MNKKLMTARSYQYGEIIKTYEKNGKPYATVKIPCDRCVKGVFVIGVENGKLKPHPNCNGVCFKCGGLGYELKEARLYTEKELDAMERANEHSRQKRAEEQERKMKAEFAENERTWKLQNGWSEAGSTWIVTGDSYSIKEELKQAGFHYDPVLRWHKAEFDERYADRLIEVKLDEVCTISAWGKGSYNPNAKSIIDEKLAATQPQSTSEWIGEVGDKIKDLKVQLIRKYNYESYYGLSTVYTFQDENGNIIVWFSSTVQQIEPYDWTRIKYATVKKHDTYNDQAQTIITRCKLVNTNS